MRVPASHCDLPPTLQLPSAHTFERKNVWAQGVPAEKHHSSFLLLPFVLCNVNKHATVRILDPCQVPLASLFRATHSGAEMSDRCTCSTLPAGANAPCKTAIATCELRAADRHNQKKKNEALHLKMCSAAALFNFVCILFRSHQVWCSCATGVARMEGGAQAVILSRCVPERTES